MSYSDLRFKSTSVIKDKPFTNDQQTSYVRVDILLPCGKHVRDPFISLRGEVLTHNIVSVQKVIGHVSMY